jgi:hypothetical protein
MSAPENSFRSFRGGVLWSAWVLANALGELFGLAIPALTGAALARWLPRSSAASAIACFAMVTAGAIEGLLVGTAQWLVLRRVFPALSRGAWLGWTAGGAAFAWALGMLPSLLIGQGAAENANNVPQITDLSKYLLAAAMGGVLGPILAVPQWFVLRRHARHAVWWIPANAVAWMLGMPVVFFALSSVVQAESVLLMVVEASGALFLTGALVGAVHGIALLALARRAIPPGFNRDESPNLDLEACQKNRGNSAITFK